MHWWQSKRGTREPVSHIQGMRGRNSGKRRRRKERQSHNIAQKMFKLKINVYSGDASHMRCMNKKQLRHSWKALPFRLRCVHVHVHQVQV